MAAPSDTDHHRPSRFRCPFRALIQRAGVMSANGILGADGGRHLRRLAFSAAALAADPPDGGSGAVPCTAWNGLMKAVSSRHGPPVFGFFPANRGFSKSVAMIPRALPANRGQDRC